MASAQSGRGKSGSGAKPAAKKTAAKKTSAAAKKTTAAKKPSATAKKSTAAKKTTTAKKSTAAKKTTVAKKPAAAKKATAPKKPSTAKKRGGGVQENPLARRSSGMPGGAGATAARAVYDEYDLPPRGRAKPRRGDGFARALPPEGRARSGGSRGGGRGFGVVNLVLLIAVLGMLGIGAWRTMEYRALAEMKALVSRQTFYAGTTVEGVDVSEMTLEQAVNYWDRQIEPGYRQAAVVLDDGTRVTALELGYSSNYADVLAGAWNAGRSGSLRQRYLRASTGSAKDYRVERRNYDDETVRRYVAALAAQTDAQPQEAHVSGFDTESYEFQFAGPSEGRVLDQEALVNAVESALNAGGGTVSRKIETIAPETTLEGVEGEYGLVASAVTNASSSSSNRLSNIRLAVSIINGTRLKPGEQFSFNETVGQRTASRGFKVATAYSSGTVTEEVGGGICQVSTTLFNAAVKADLQIDERHPHSLTVAYVDLGKDAAVDWSSKDLKFTNNSDDDIYIACLVTDDKRIRFGVFGKLLPDGETITVEGVRTGKVDFETQYQTSFELNSGEMRKLQEGKAGYTATTYKIRWDADGNVIDRSELCKSKYQSTPEIIEYGP